MLITLVLATKHAVGAFCDSVFLPCAECWIKLAGFMSLNPIVRGANEIVSSLLFMMMFVVFLFLDFWFCCFNMISKAHKM